MDLCTCAQRDLRTHACARSDTGIFADCIAPGPDAPFQVTKDGRSTMFWWTQSSASRRSGLAIKLAASVRHTKQKRVCMCVCGTDSAQESERVAKIRSA